MVNVLSSLQKGKAYLKVALLPVVFLNSHAFNLRKERSAVSLELRGKNTLYGQMQSVPNMSLMWYGHTGCGSVVVCSRTWRLEHLLGEVHVMPRWIISQGTCLGSNPITFFLHIVGFGYVSELR